MYIIPYWVLHDKVAPVLKSVDSRNTQNVQRIARGNVWDAKKNGTTTIMFESGNICNVIYILKSYLWDAKRNGTTTSMFESRNHSAQQQESTKYIKTAPATKSGPPKYERTRLKRLWQCAADPRPL